MKRLFQVAILTLATLLFTSSLPPAVLAAPYGEGSYAGCGYSDGCNDTGLSNTGQTARGILLISGGILLLAGATVAWKRHHKKQSVDYQT